MKCSKKLSPLVFLCLWVCNSTLYGQIKLDSTQTFLVSDNMSYTYKKTKFFDMLKYIPQDLVDSGKFIVKKENLVWTGAALGSTALIIPFDQSLIDESIKFGKNFNFHKGHSYSNIGPLRIIPNDINSAVYYIGNGGTTMLLSGIFYTIGAINKDYRALNTSSELVEVLLGMGVVTQSIKRITGRQSPGPAMRSGNPGGNWTLLPLWVLWL